MPAGRQWVLGAPLSLPPEDACQLLRDRSRARWALDRWEPGRDRAEKEDPWREVPPT